MVRCWSGITLYRVMIGNVNFDLIWGRQFLPSKVRLRYMPVTCVTQRKVVGPPCEGEMETHDGWVDDIYPIDVQEWISSCFCR